MTIPLAFELLLVALLLAVATWTIAVRDAFPAVVAFVVYGLLLAIAWVQLAAIDVALREAAIGSGVTGMLLLDAATRLRKTEAAATPPGMPLRIAEGALCALVSAGLAAIVLTPPDPAPSLAPMATANLAQSGLGNPVAGVLFVYRALDTLRFGKGLVAIVDPARRATLGLGRMLERVDGILRQWPVAGLSLLALALLFGAALLTPAPPASYFRLSGRHSGAAKRNRNPAHGNHR